MDIRSFVASDTDAVIALWDACDLTRPWNDPRKDIERKQQVQGELFLVGEIDGKIEASVMAGYDGHRGWMNYLAVSPASQKGGLGRKIVAAAEEKLRAMGCPKINVQIRSTNTDALGFYASLGFTDDAVSSMGKRLIEDDE